MHRKKNVWKPNRALFGAQFSLGLLFCCIIRMNFGCFYMYVFEYLVDLFRFTDTHTRAPVTYERTRRVPYLVLWLKCGAEYSSAVKIAIKFKGTIKLWQPQHGMRGASWKILNTWFRHIILARTSYYHLLLTTYGMWMFSENALFCVDLIPSLNAIICVV